MDVIESIEKDMTPILLEDLGYRNKHRYGLYECPHCGNIWTARSISIKSGKTKSCGCMQGFYIGESKTKHGFWKHILYQTWNSMQTRCYNENSKNYKNYGARGIQVCKRWLDVKNFIEDMYPSYQEGLTLDRIDVNGNYEPDNCRWATKTTQMQNTKSIHSNNTSGFRGVYWHKGIGKWVAKISVNTKQIPLGLFHTAIEAAKAYETYVRANSLEHNFTPVLSEEEIQEIEESKNG